MAFRQHAFAIVKVVNTTAIVPRFERGFQLMTAAKLNGDALAKIKNIDETHIAERGWTYVPNQRAKSKAQS